MHKGRSDSDPLKSSPEIDVDKTASSETSHSGVTHPPTQKAREVVFDKNAHSAALKDHFRRSGLKADGSSAPRVGPYSKKKGK
jgi:hypothetical protein